MNILLGWIIVSLHIFYLFYYTSRTGSTNRNYNNYPKIVLVNSSACDLGIYYYYYYYYTECYSKSHISLQENIVSEVFWVCMSASNDQYLDRLKTNY